MATRNSSEVERRRSRVRHTHTQARPRILTRYAASSGGSTHASGAVPLKALHQLLVRLLGTDNRRWCR
jgi:hypothetical protein